MAAQPLSSFAQVFFPSDQVVRTDTSSPSTSPATTSEVVLWSARIRKLSLKLGAPNLPGDVMVMTGRVQAKNEPDVVVEVVGKNAWGNHVTAKIELSLPR